MNNGDAVKAARSLGVEFWWSDQRPNDTGLFFLASFRYGVWVGVKCGRGSDWPARTELPSANDRPKSNEPY